MFLFCFNDSIPKNGSDDELVRHLSVTLKHFDFLKRKYPIDVDGIITDRLPEKVILNCANFSLADCIKFLERELKKIAFSNFGKYPVDHFFDQVDIERLVVNEYTIKVNGGPIDATNAKIVHENEGIMFTLPLHNDLRKNSLVIYANQEHCCEVLSQYGAEENTSFISNLIREDIISRSDGFDKLLKLVENYAYNERFKQDFNNLTFATQNKLLSRIENLIKRNAKTKLYPDDETVKDVTPDKEKEIKVFELRVHEPVAIRMYFYETTEKIYFGSIEKKPKMKVQDNDILNASSVIKELIVFEKHRGLMKKRMHHSFDGE